jgi:hypothetical protein
MMKLFLIFFLFIGLFSCTDNATKDILTVKQMQEIQWDLMRADELAEYNHAADTLYHAKQKREQFYDQIFAIHHTNKKAFERSLNYYTARPKELKLILDSIEAKAKRVNAADSVKPARDTAAIRRDTSRISHTVDSLKRKKGLKFR